MSEERQNEEKKATQDKQAGEPIFEGGPTARQVENWKQQYGDIYQIEFDDQVFIYRTISRFEYKKLINNVEGGGEGQMTPMGNSDPSQVSWFREEQICNACVVWPEDYDHDAMSEGKAGIPTVIAEYVMSSSGFNSNGGPQKL